MSTLLLRLTAPLQAWRPVSAAPSAATEAIVRWRRLLEARQRLRPELAARLRFGRADRAGSLLRDYYTAAKAKAPM